MDTTTPAHILQERADRDARAQAHRLYEDFQRRNEAEFNAINARNAANPGAESFMTAELAGTGRVAMIFAGVKTEENYNAAVCVLLKSMSRIAKEYYDARNGATNNDPAWYAAYGEVLREALNNYVIPTFD